MKPIPYSKQHISEEDIKAVIDVLKSDYLTQGPKIAEFENAFSDYIGAKYAVAVYNGTVALHLSALALGVNETSKVITTPITFVASANCIKYCCGSVYFVDIDKDSYCIDLNEIEDILKKSPEGEFSGIIPVDFAGYPVNLEDLRVIADKYNLWILEDACHAPGGFFKDSNKDTQNCGNGKYADLSVFSFHPVKHIATGEGGMITTNNKKLYEYLLLLRTHGITKNPQLLQENHGGWYYEMQKLGYNYRITDIQAALGINQLKRAEKSLARRQEIAEKYNNAFKDTPIITPKLEQGVSHAWHLYIIKVDNRKALYDYLRKEGIYTQIHYIPIHLHPYYRQFGWKKGDFPITEDYYDKCLSLPMYPTLTKEEQDYVIQKVKVFLNDKKINS